MSEQMHKTIYDDSPAEVQALIELCFQKWGAEDYRLDLVEKAKRIRPREQKRLKTKQDALRDIWKAAREDGVAPDIAEVQKLWTESQALNKEIRKAQDKKNVGAKARRPYSEAVKLYREDERTLLVSIRGKEITPTKRLDPSILARIEVLRKAKAKKARKGE